MAYVIGLVSRKEADRLRKMDWKLEEAPVELHDSEPDDEVNDAFEMVMVWVDCDVSALLDAAETHEAENG